MVTFLTVSAIRPYGNGVLVILKLYFCHILSVWTIKMTFLCKNDDIISSHYNVSGKTRHAIRAQRCKQRWWQAGIDFVMQALQSLLTISLQNLLSLCHLQENQRRVLQYRHFVSLNQPTRRPNEENVCEVSRSSRSS